MGIVKWFDTNFSPEFHSRASFLVFSLAVLQTIINDAFFSVAAAFAPMRNFPVRIANPINVSALVFVSKVRLRYFVVRFV